MINVLLNINNFGDEFAYRKLRRIIRPNHRVLIIPLSYHEDYITCAEEYNREFSKGSPEIENIIKEFNKYGIKRKNIRILHYYNDDADILRNKFKWADILFFTGGYPDRALYRIYKLGIRDHIVNFDGVVIGTSAGAMIQLDEYHVTPEEDDGEYQYHTNGLGLLSGFDIEVHYEDNPLHISGIITALKDRDKIIYAMANEGGLIVKNDNIIPIGKVTDFDQTDVDMLQFVLDERINAN